MASDGAPGAITAASAVTTSQVSEPTKFQAVGGKTLPQGGIAAPAPAASTTIGSSLPQSSNTASQSATSGFPSASNAGGKNAGSSTSNAASSAQTNSTTDPQTLVNQANKTLNQSGRADQFRLDPTSTNYIQQVNPSTGEVVAEYPVNEFPALAVGLGTTGLLLDETA